MKVLAVLAAFLALASVLGVDEMEIEMIFEKVLEDEGITLSGSEYPERLALFTLNYEPGEEANLEMMYTVEELQGQNGAKMINSLRSELAEELEKRGEDPFSLGGASPPPFYGGIEVNEAVHQDTCGNCYLHTFIAALEISYFKATGKKRKFSAQEMTDCYEDGCGGGDYRMVATYMSYLDKLGLKEQYGDYKSDQLTCRGSTTPDGLTDVKVAGYIEVPSDVRKIEAAIVKYGSVMTCMKWGVLPGDLCYMSKYRAGTIVDYEGVPGGCDHAVLVTGYTPTYWIVRNSHGKDWGHKGYFFIAKGGNSCGIEETMAVLVVAPRESAKAIARNGCPEDKPNYCHATHACTSGRGCAKPITLIEEEVVAEEELEKRTPRMPGEVQREKRDLDEETDIEVREEEEERRRPKNNRDFGKDPYILGRLARMLEKRGMLSEEDAARFYGDDDDFQTDKEERAEADVELDEADVELDEADVELAARCADRTPHCAAQAVKQNVCVGGFLQFCLAFCKKCTVRPPKINVKDDGELHGNCLKPTIANGEVKNPGSYLRPGDVLQVECNSGFELVGKPAKCLLQDGYTNADKDGRLLQECIRVDAGAVLVGDGSSYIGTKNTYAFTNPYGQTVEAECDSWNKDILRGILPNYKDGNSLLLGNHNYCRNPGGMEPVPFCIGNAGGVGNIRYCFGRPGCESCAGATNDYDDSFCEAPSNTRFCLYTDKATRNRVASIQNRCNATCCRLAGC